MMAKRTIAIILLFLMTFSLSSCKEEKKTKTISPAKMMQEQLKYYKETETLMNDMAYIYSQYFANNISKNEFVTEIEGFRFNYDNMLKRYNEFMENNELDKGKPYMTIELATACMEEIRKTVGEILEMSVIDGKVMPRAMLYEYYALKHEKISTTMQNFYVVLTMSIVTFE
jgi:hypothetical protein